MKAMGFKDRGSTKYCFKHYDSNEEESEVNSDTDLIGPSSLLDKRKQQNTNYQEQIRFKNNFYGLGY